MRTLALLLALIVIPAGCSDDTSPPALDMWQPQPDLTSNACSTCTGCCLGGNQCMPGTSVAACGFGGLTCQACGGTDQCVKGTCVPQAPKCDASNCAQGCCSSAGVCIELATTAACGKGGAACKTCAATEVCTAGACESAGPKTYAVKIISAEVSNSDCGFGDNCDPYAEVALGGGAVVTTNKLDATEKPVWDFKLFDATDKELLATPLKVTVKDNDGALNPDDELGTCDLTVTQAELTAGQLVADCGTKVKNVTFSFKVAP